MLCVHSDWTHNEQSWWGSSFPRMTSAESSRSFIIFIWEGRPFDCSLFSNRYTIKGRIIPPSGNHFINKGHVEPHLLSLPDGLYAQATEGSLNEYLTFWLRKAAILLLCWQKVKGNPPCRFALHYLIVSVNSEAIKTKVATFRLSIQ